jgi:hypothetical protein
MKCTGSISPKVNHIMKSFSFNALPDKTNMPKVNTVSSNNTSETASPNVLRALGEVFKTIGENLMWFFIPALVIGLYYRFRDNAKREELFLVTAFVTMNVAMMVLRYCYIQLHASQRWSLPLITFTIFYIPVGLHVVANWLNKKMSHPKQKKKQLSWFVILFLIGVGICMPKLFRPIRIEKQGYRDAAQWLRENTAPADIIAVSDKRISFYAERKGLEHGKKVPEQEKYIVGIVKDGDQPPKFGRAIQARYSVWMNKKKMKKRIVIYEVL